MIYIAPVTAALIALSSIAIILSSKYGKKIQDIPNERSLHAVPTPRSGGVGLMAGVLSGWTLLAPSLPWWLPPPLLILFAVSLLDDVRNLPVKQRLLAQLVAGSILVAGSGILAQQGVVVALAVLLFAVWMTNLYNFMDGSDGLAGGMALFGFACYGIAALTGGGEAFAMLNLSISAAALGFLFFNFPPAKIFMGDAGSIPLGFLAAAIGVWGWQQGHWAPWFPLLVFSPFIVDASVTLLKRAMRGAKITEAHREHYYQRAIQLGWSHRRVALLEYALMLGVGVSALAALDQALPWLLLFVWGGIFGALMLALDLEWKKSRRGTHA